MLLLFETAAGFALFKVLKEDRLQKVDDLFQDFEDASSASKFVKLKAFSKFENTTEALAAATALVDSKLSKGLKKFLKKHVQEETLAIVDSKLGSIIKEKLGINCVYSNAILELTRGVRNQLQNLISGLAGADLTPMSLGLSHSLSRYKLKFSPDKVDTMIVQAIGLLDDLDKELNTYAMRVREWYGWHFPEMTKIVADNIQYAKTVKFMGTREKAAGLDFSGILAEEVEGQLKEAAVISMGTEISQNDLDNIAALCDQVIDLADYRGQLFDYLKSRMTAIAPNLTVLVGELVGARLIAHAGSLINLAKQPASTVQILGAEKALFRALKTKHDTPKYGLIYHASLIGQSSAKFKGKISRVLAAKCSLAIRVDALGDSMDATLGLEARQKVEARLRQLEGKALATDGAKAKGKADFEKYDKSRQAGPTAAMQAGLQSYNPDADVVPADGDKKDKKKKRKKDAEEQATEDPAVADGGEDEAMAAADVPVEDGEKKKKKKKKKSGEEGGEDEDEEPKKKKKKKDKKGAEGISNGGDDGEQVKEKKKKKK